MTGLLCFAGAASAGCAVIVGEAPHGPDVRGAVALRRDQPRMVMAGPGWLLHVNDDKRGRVSLYRVAKRTGTGDECTRAGGGLPASAEPVHATARVSLYVPATDVVCASSPTTARLSWHAQPLAAPDVTREAVATLQ